MQFRLYHLSTVLKRFELQKGALDSFLNRYFRDQKAIGSKDRRFISEAIYRYFRWKNLYEYLKIDPTIELSNFKDDSLPMHVQLGTPLELYNHLVQIYGEDKTKEICLINNSRAPLTIRVNPAKISRDTLLQNWKNFYPVAPCPQSPWGIYFFEKINFHSLKEFKDGFFEIQDEGSQLLAGLVKAKPKEKILDYCAGSGGKSLAIAHLLEGKGQIYLHDIRPRALQEARKRFHRAKVQNVQFSISSSLHNKMDWVIVDVPCSGTGTLRRNPDLKWKFEYMDLKNLIQEQREIFKQALHYLSPSGKIVFMTCSILPEENEQQIAYFQKEYGLECVEKFQSLPQQDGMDGFFGVTLTRV